MTSEHLNDYMLLAFLVGMIKLEIDISSALAELAAMGRACDPRPILKLIGARVLSFVDQNFRTHGVASGEEWRPLRPSTLQQRKHGGSAILQDSGALKQSFFYDVQSDSTVWVGTRVRHAAYHEYGTKPYTIKTVRAKVLAAQLRAGGFALFGKSVRHPGLPARPMLPSQSVAERFIESEIDNYFENVRA